MYAHAREGKGKVCDKYFLLLWDKIARTWDCKCVRMWWTKMGDITSVSEFYGVAALVIFYGSYTANLSWYLRK